MSTDNPKVPNVDLINQQLLEEQHMATRLYVLLYIWLLITIFVITVFVLSMVSENGFHPLANYVFIFVFLFSFYYIYKNIL